MSNITGLSNLYASSALNAHNDHTEKAGVSIKQLSSGSRFTSAAVDASSAAIVNNLNSNIGVYRQTEINARNGSALIQVGTGVISNQIDLINQMKTLATQAAGGDLDSSKRALIDTQFQQLFQQLDSNAARARWNGTSLLLGSGGAVTQVGTAAAHATNIVDGANVITAGVVAASTKGFVSGTASSVSVTANHTIAANSDISLVIQDPSGNKQTFQALNVSPANGALLTLISTTDPNNAMTFTLGTAAAGVAAPALQTALSTAFGLNAGGAAASFSSDSTALVANVVAGVTAGSGTTAGTYALSYDGGNSIKLSTENSSMTATVSGNGAQNVTFSNGVTVSLGANFAVGTPVAQSVFTVGTSSSSSITLQLDLLSTDTQTVQFSAATTGALGLTGLKVTDQASANLATTALTSALQTLNTSYTQLGAAQKRLEATVTNLTTTIQNNEAARSVYGDADIALALTEFVKENTMQQVSFTAISQAIDMQRDLGSFVRNS
ncbi:MAG: flagellin [Janthinobacterium lividum]